MIFKKVLAAGVAAALAVGVMVAASGCAGSGKLKVATSADYPPYENLVDGKYEGFDIALMEAVAKECGYEGVEWVNMDFDSIVPSVVSGEKCKVAIACLGIDAERAKEINFSDAYMTDEMTIAIMKESGITKANLNDASKIIAVQSGTTCEDYAQETFPQAQILSFKNATDCYAAMQSGKANAVCANSSIAKNMVENSYKDAELLYSENTGEAYAIVVQKDADGKTDNADLLKKINSAIKKLQNDGTIDKLIVQYLSESVE